MKRENKRIEYKQNINSKTYLKTVSAFANFGDGSIFFGITDDLKVIGIEDPKKACLDIENNINGNFDPAPAYTLTILDHQIIELSVKEGNFKPYLLKGKAYKRNDTSTVEVSREELKRLTLVGMNLSFEELESRKQDLKFTKLEKRLQESLQIKELSKDIQKTLGLITSEGKYNNAAAMLADENDFEGVDMVKFGEDINEIADREIDGHTSVLTQIDRALHFYRRYYQFEKIETLQRYTVEKVPEKAFREALLNAVMHRDWLIPTEIHIAMYKDRIIIVSPGGLPDGMREEDYLNGHVSIPGNRMLSDILYRLKYIEKFGTGILRIKASYANVLEKPKFEVFENSIRVTLPVIQSLPDLKVDESKVLDIIEKQPNASRLDIEKESGFNKNKVIRVVNRLLEKNLVQKTGTGKSVRYHKTSWLL